MKIAPMRHVLVVCLALAWMIPAQNVFAVTGSQQDDQTRNKKELKKEEKKKKAEKDGGRHAPPMFTTTKTSGARECRHRADVW
jgi:hypothetical protein